MIRPCVPPVLPPLVPLLVLDARTVLLVTSFVAASPVEARLLELLLTALGKIEVAVGSVLTLLEALAFSSSTRVILIVTWIFDSHNDVLLFHSFFFSLWGR